MSSMTEAADDIFGQFFRIDGTVNNIKEDLCGVNLLGVAFYLLRQTCYPEQMLLISELSLLRISCGNTLSYQSASNKP